MPPAKPNRAQRRAADKAGETAAITIKVDGVAYTLRLSEVTALDTSALRRATSLSLRGVMATLEDDADLDTLAAVVWLARRQNGEPKLAYEVVASAIGYDADISTGDEPDEEDEDSPEA